MELNLDYVKAFESYLRSLNKSPHTMKQYTLDARQFVEITQNPDEINEALQRYTTAIQTQYSSVNSINRKLAATRQFLLFLRSRGVISVYNEALLQPLVKPQTALNMLDKKQFTEVLRFWPHQYNVAETEEHAWLALRNTALVFTIAELGIKPAELVRMQWKHIDEQALEIIILASKSYRSVPCTAKLLELFADYKQATAQFLPLAEHTPYIWLGIGNKTGEAITVKTVERIFKAMSQQLPFPVTATTMRYYAIGKQLKNEPDPHLIYEQFGYARKGVLTERERRFRKRQ